MTHTNKLDIFQNSLIGIVHGFVFLPVLLFAFELNRLSGSRYLVVYFILTQVTAVLLKKWWPYIIVQCAQLLAFIYVLFPPTETPLSLLTWFRETGAEGLDQWRLLLASELSETPMLLIMTLLFAAITLLTYLTVQRKLAIPSFLTGFIYLMVVHTFTANRVLPEVIQLIGFGFLLIALMQMNTRTTWFSFIKSVTLTALFTLGLTSLSVWGVDRLRPTQEWIEVRSQGYQKELDDRGVFDWINTYSSGIGFRRTGIGLDDSTLGGPLRQDFTPLFRAYTSEPHYWKVLHRIEYNGNGWESNENELGRPVYSPYNVRYDITTTSAEREQMMREESINTVPVEWLDEAAYIAYPYGWYDLDIDNREAPYILQRFDSISYFSLESDEERLTDYTVTYDSTFPSRFDDDLLRVDDGWRDAYFNLIADNSEDDQFDLADTEEMMAMWFGPELQLPETLPQRVVDLAHELTDEYENEYDKVRALERYLKEEGGFRYSLLEVENTPDDGDYVDHFLFESKIGYCNNFSTAMTIMLRAIDIPARWSKGFTPGTQYTDDAGETFYQVSNSNAHSWVEVYFPSHGWVPFEPSPSFANPMTNPEPVATVGGETYTFEEDDFINPEDELLENDTQAEESTSDESDEEDAAALAGIDAGSDYDGPSTDETSFAVRWSLLLNLSGIFFVLISTLMVIFRWRLTASVFRLIVRREWIRVDRACSGILNLFRFKLKREPGQTVGRYLNQWTPFIPKKSRTVDDFTALTDSLFYGPEQSDSSWTLHQKETVIGMIDLLEDLPDLKRHPREPHPLSGKLIQ